MILNDNAIDYVYWDDPNELVNDCSDLLRTERATTLTITRCCRSSKNFMKPVILYYKLNRVQTKRVSQNGVSEKKKFFCSVYYALNHEKRKISFERR